MSEHAPSGPGPGPAHSARMDPRALALADAARLLTRLGGRAVTEAMLREDVTAGCPTNADGTLNLVSYAAWLMAARRARGDRPEAFTSG